MLTSSPLHSSLMSMVTSPQLWLDGMTLHECTRGAADLPLEFRLFLVDVAVCHLSMVFRMCGLLFLVDIAVCHLSVVFWTISCRLS
jgi:hypothetical protein